MAGAEAAIWDHEGELRMEEQRECPWNTRSHHTALESLWPLWTSEQHKFLSHLKIFLYYMQTKLSLN